MQSCLVGYVGGESQPVLPDEFVIDDSVRILLPRMMTASDYENMFLLPLVSRIEALLEEYCRSAFPDANFSFIGNSDYVQHEFGCINISATTGVRAYLKDMMEIFRSAYRSSSEEYKKFNLIYNDINVLIANYVIKNPLKFADDDRYKKEYLAMIEQYPITKDGTAICVYAGSELPEAMERISSIIKKHFEGYTHQVMYGQEKECGIIHNTYTFGKKAFSGMKNLTAITLSSGVTGVEYDAFFGCDKLANIKVNEESKYLSSIDGNLYSAEGKVLMIYAPGKTEESFLLPSGAEGIDEQAFFEKNIKSIIIPDGVTEIKPYAFYGLKFKSEDNKVKFVFPETVTKIGEEAFALTQLSELTLPESLSVIERGAFINAGIEKIHLPKNVSFVGVSAFRGNSITAVTVDENNTVYHVAGNCLIHTENKILVFGGINYQIPDDGSVEIIGYNAFSNLPGLETVYIPDSVIYIMPNAFSENSELSGLVYEGEPFFFINQTFKVVDEVMVTEYSRGDNYDRENQNHKWRLLSSVNRNDLCRSEEKIEYYSGIYINYIK
jgi:hypothetical protein